MKMRALAVLLMLGMFGSETVRAGEAWIDIPAGAVPLFQYGRYRAQASTVQILSNNNPNRLLVADNVPISLPQFRVYPDEILDYKPINPILFEKSQTPYQVVIRALWSGGGGIVNPMCYYTKTQYAMVLEVAFFSGCAETANTIIRMRLTSPVVPFKKKRGLRR